MSTEPKVGYDSSWYRGGKVAGETKRQHSNPREEPAFHCREIQCPQLEFYLSPSLMDIFRTLMREMQSMFFFLPKKPHLEPEKASSAKGGFAPAGTVP